jgi:hypothetical protein
MGMGGVFFEEVNSRYGWGVFCCGRQWVWVGCLLRMSTMGMGGVFI